MPSKRRSVRVAQSLRAKATAQLKRRVAARYGISPKQVTVQGGKVSVPPRAYYAKVRHAEQKKAATAAISRFRPRKSDAGKYVIVGQGGKRDTKKGYAVYVTKSGKVWHPKKGITEPYKARPRNQVQVSARGSLARAANEFREGFVHPGSRGSASASDIKRARKAAKEVGGDAGARLADFIESGQGRGRSHVKTGGSHEFSAKVVTKIARHIQGVAKEQASHRNFNIRAMGLVKLPDGSQEVIEFNVTIERSDADAIKLAGVENFVKQKFWAMFAQQLARIGAVTAGSSNHIRNLRANRGKSRENWVDKRGDAWAGRHKQIAHLESLEWKIEQQ